MNFDNYEEYEKDILTGIETMSNEDAYLFVTTFKRYIDQTKTLKRLSDVIEASDTVITKEYVKGRENVYVHPAITEYNKTSDSANKTMQTLINLLNRNGSGSDNPLLKLFGDDD